MKRWILLICIFAISGCAWIGFGDDQEEVIKESEPIVQIQFVEEGRINSLRRLQEGGRLLIKPFSAGPDVEVSEQTDKIALRVMRGIMDVYEGEGSFENLATDKFDMAVMEDEDDADLKLHGRITEIADTSNWKKWVLMKPKMVLSVEGWLVDVKNRITVLSFKDSIKVEAKSSTYGDLAQQLGRNIGQLVFTKR